MTAIHTLALACHPHTRTDAVQAIGVRVRRSPAGVLTITYSVDANLKRLCIQPTGSPRLVHGLWEHTCVEAFIGLEQTSAYHEFNFAPSREWMMYTFHAYREIAPMPDQLPAPEVRVHRSPNRLDLDVALRLHALSPAHPIAPLRLAIAAVIEDASGQLSYWALRHPPGRPDFHHAQAFALTLPAPGVDSNVDPR